DRHLHPFPTRRSSDLQQPAPEIAFRRLLAVELHIDMALFQSSELAAAQLDGAGNAALALAAELQVQDRRTGHRDARAAIKLHTRSEEHTSELQSRSDL